MKRYIIYSFAILAFIGCRKVEKETDEVIDEPQKVVEDSLAPKVLEEPITRTRKQIKEDLKAKGFQTYDYIDEKTHDTIVMQQYFMAFLKSGPIRSQNEEEAALLQKEHEAHLRKMYELGYADISKPFEDNSNIRSVTIYNVPTFKMADSLAHADPMVKEGRLVVEIHPWWAAKGSSLRE
uniref:YciI family protein n=1 Tax=Mariniflexile sp. TaxID=1979402 RepID=UPI004048102F